MADVPNPLILRRARRIRKLSTSEVADYTGIAEARLAQFEEGRTQPSIAQLTRLGSLYNVELFNFFEDEIPNIAATLPDFRKSTPSAADLSPRGLSRIWQVEGASTFISTVQKALGNAAPKKLSIERLTNSTRPEPAELRSGFDAWLHPRQKSLKLTGDGEDLFSRQFRLFLDVHGCSTVYNAAPVEDYLGFYQAPEDGLGTIFVNRNVRQDKRRLFTLAHEAAHFVFNEQGVSNPFVANNSIEKRCNRFAAEFLAPDRLVLDIVGSAKFSLSRDIGRLVNLVASKTLLSRQASTIRLYELDVITKTQSSEQFRYLSHLRNVAEPNGEKKSGPVGLAAAVGRKLSEVGVHAAYIAKLALARKLIDTVDIERGLGISEKLQKPVLDLASRRYEASAD